MLLDKVKTIAKERGMTLKEVSAASGVKYDTLMSWNDHVPGALSVWKVSKALNVPLSDLLDEVEKG